jgi:hypothetical protein
MNNSASLGAWIRRFLMEYLVGDRNLTDGHELKLTR